MHKEATDSHIAPVPASINPECCCIGNQGLQDSTHAFFARVTTIPLLRRGKHGAGFAHTMQAYMVGNSEEKAHTHLRPNPLKKQIESVTLERSKTSKSTAVTLVHIAEGCWKS